MIWYTGHYKWKEKRKKEWAEAIKLAEQPWEKFFLWIPEIIDDRWYWFEWVWRKWYMFKDSNWHHDKVNWGYWKYKPIQKAD